MYFNINKKNYASREIKTHEKYSKEFDKEKEENNENTLIYIPKEKIYLDQEEYIKFIKKQKHREEDYYEKILAYSRQYLY